VNNDAKAWFAGGVLILIFCFHTSYIRPMWCGRHVCASIMMLDRIELWLRVHFRGHCGVEEHYLVKTDFKALVVL